MMSKTKKVVELFYDVVSPYSWLGFEVLCRYRNVWNIDLQLRPAFLGGIMQGSGNKPPGLVPNKFLYMTKDLSRLAEYFEIPLRAPSDPFEAMFKKGSLSAMRFVTAVSRTRAASVEPVSRELWHRIWSRDQDITEAASLTEAGLKAGLPPSTVEELLQLAHTQEVKEGLKAATQEALDHGVRSGWAPTPASSQRRCEESAPTPAPPKDTIKVLDLPDPCCRHFSRPRLGGGGSPAWEGRRKAQRGGERRRPSAPSERGRSALPEREGWGKRRKKREKAQAGGDRRRTGQEDPAPNEKPGTGQERNVKLTDLR